MGTVFFDRSELECPACGAEAITTDTEGQVQGRLGVPSRNQVECTECGAWVQFQITPVGEVEIFAGREEYLPTLRSAVGA